MKVYFKSIILLLILFLLSGCGWSDIQKEYSDLLKEEISCVYGTSEINSKRDFYSIESIEMSVDYNGFYTNFGDGRVVIFDNDGVKNLVSAKNYQFNFSNDFIESYFKKYQEKNACPESISISKENQNVNIGDCNNEDKCVQYNLKTNTITNKNGIQKNCHHSLAIDCEKFSKDKDENGEKAYIEIGYYEIAGKVKKYFGVSSDENYRDIIIDEDESDGFSVYQNTEGFDVPIEAINEIWFDNEKFISTSLIMIKAEYTTFTTYFITGTELTNPGVIESGQITKAPNLDPDRSLSIPIVDLSTRLNYDNMCFNAGILRAFWILGSVINIIKWIAPFVIIILGMVDFGKAMIENDESALKKSTEILFRRIIAGVLIFFVPTFVGVATKTLLSYNVFDENNEFFSCTACLFDSGNCGETVKILQEQENARAEEKRQNAENSYLAGNKYTKEEIMAIDNATARNMSNEEFIEFIGSAARIVYSEYGGVLPSITVAQAILESGYGNYIYAATYNPYGLIGYPGHKPQLSGRLRIFDNFYESTYYHYLYFENYSNAYATFMGHCKNNDALVAATELYRYAGGESNYPTKIIQLINQYDLTRFDV